MGQSLLKNYSVDKDSYMSAGYNCLWKVHKGRSKLKEGDLASVFVFEKKRLEKFKEKDKEEILNILRKEANFLLKFRHPGLLSVNESLIEDKNSMMFAAEYVPQSLSTMLEKQQLTILEMKMMMIELVDTLIFLHEDAKVIHSYINPDGIFLDDKGKLKLSSFCFAISDPNVMGNTPPTFNLNMVEAPNANYLAPEAVLNNKINYRSDIYSFGIVIAYLTKKIKNQTVNLNNTSLDSYQRNLGNNNSFYDKFFSVLTQKLDPVEIELLRNMLNYSSDQRVSAKGLRDQAWFNDHIITAIRFIENIETNDNNKNMVFFSQFPKILEKFEDKIIIKKILPKYIDILKLETFTNNALPGIFTIAEKLGSGIDFEMTIWPNIKELFKMKQMSAASLFFLITKLEFISKKIPSSEFSEHMLKIICKALDSNLQKLQKAVFERLDVITKTLESQVFKNHIYERMISIVAQTTHADVKMTILTALKDTYRLLDQNTINDSFLNTLEKVRKGDNKSDVCLKLVSIYQEISKIVSIKSISNKILPNLIGILTSGEISKKDFESIMKLVHTYLNEIQEMRKKELEDLDNNKNSGVDANLFENQNKTSTPVVNKKDDEMFMQFMMGGVTNKNTENINPNIDPFEALFADTGNSKSLNNNFDINNSTNNTGGKNSFNTGSQGLPSTSSGFYNDLEEKPKRNDNLFNPSNNKTSDPFNFSSSVPINNPSTSKTNEINFTDLLKPNNKPSNQTNKPNFILSGNNKAKSNNNYMETEQKPLTNLNNFNFDLTSNSKPGNSNLNYDNLFEFSSNNNNNLTNNTISKPNLSNNTNNNPFDFDDLSYLGTTKSNNSNTGNNNDLFNNFNQNKSNLNVNNNNLSNTGNNINNRNSLGINNSSNKGNNINFDNWDFTPTTNANNAKNKQKNALDDLLNF